MVRLLLLVVAQRAVELEMVQVALQIHMDQAVVVA
jgi:hypothetical protein